MNGNQSICVRVTRAARRGALLATVLLGAFSVHAAAAAADTIATDHRVFEFKNAYGGNVADVAGGHTAEGTRIIQWPSHGGPNQRWRLRGSFLWGPLPNGEYRSVYVIESQHSGLCLEPEPVNGAIKVRQARCDIYPNAKQFWYLRRNSYGYYTIQNMETMTMLHVPNTSAGSELSLTNEFGVTDRMWALRETKLPYSVDTPGVTAVGRDRDERDRILRRRLADRARRRHLESPLQRHRRRRSQGDRNHLQRRHDQVLDLRRVRPGEQPPQDQARLLQNSGRDASRNYALTGRVRFYCVPGTSF
jgi:hypothetical protein